MTDTAFVDTNVFVYSRDTTERDKHRAARHWVEMLWDNQLGRTSFQVLNEYYVTVTRKLDRKMTPSNAYEDVQDLMTWNPVTFSAMLLDESWAIQARFGFSWWDSLVIAAAKEAGSNIILTEDLQSGQSIDGLVVVSPFLVSPEAHFG